MLRIDEQRYAAVAPDELRGKMLAELMPVVYTMKIQRNRCLVATYFHPAVTAGGIHLTNKTIAENRWQGKVGLLLKVGPAAFDYVEVHEHVQELMEIGGMNLTDATGTAHIDLGIPQVGDWIAYRASETHEIGVKVETGIAASCRIIEDDFIVAVVDDPSVIW